MDITTIATIATNLAEARTAQAAGVSILRKAIDQESAGALQLIQSIQPNMVLPPHLGRLLNTVA